MTNMELKLPVWYDYEPEPCKEVHEREEKAFEGQARSFQGLIKNTPGCSTSACNALSQQLIHQMNVMFPDTLVSWDEKPRVLKVSTPMTEGSDVFQVQKALQDKEFDLKPDGYFGERTATVVKQFQENSGIEVDGVVRANTLAKLFA